MHAVSRVGKFRTIGDTGWRGENAEKIETASNRTLALVASATRNSVRIRWFWDITGIFPILFGHRSQGWDCTGHCCSVGRRVELVDISLVGASHRYSVLNLTVSSNRGTRLG